MSKLQERLTEIMKEKKLSYPDLEKMSGVPKSSIQRYATGTTKQIPFERVEKIASALNVDPLWLLGYDAVSSDDRDVVSALASRAKPLLELPPDIAALNVLLYDIGEVIQRTDDGYFTASTGFLSDDDIAFLKSTASNALRPAIDMLAKRHEWELRSTLSGKEKDA